jgi:hypothetical protein
MLFGAALLLFAKTPEEGNGSKAYREKLCGRETKSDQKA